MGGVLRARVDQTTSTKRLEVCFDICRYDMQVNCLTWRVYFAELTDLKVLSDRSDDGR